LVRVIVKPGPSVATSVPVTEGAASADDAVSSAATAVIDAMRLM
jgi:hypothetical protein